MNEYPTPSKALIKQVRQLHTSSGRAKAGKFIAQGTKCVTDTIGHFDCHMLFATVAWIDEHPELISQAKTIYKASRVDLEPMTTPKDTPPVIAVYRIDESKLNLAKLQTEVVIALDCVQDPGNLGTIMRLADWMGVRTILASRDTVDVYNPKVVQATMGSISRVKVHYVDDLASTLGRLHGHDVPVMGTFMLGESIYDFKWPSTGVLVMGNEGRGISDAVAEQVSRRLTIPRYTPATEGPESLNVAVATAIAVSEWRRQLTSLK